MITLADQMKKEVLKGYIGHNMDVLLEQELKKSNKAGDNNRYKEEDSNSYNSIDIEGLTSNYLPVVVSIPKERIGHIVNVKLESIEGEHLRGSS